jgi:hypothetical protein
MTMVRKQVRLTPEQVEKLRTTAARLGCSESHVLRMAIDRLEDRDEAPREAEDE